MGARPLLLAATLALVLPGHAATPARRIVSLNPSLTATVLTLGAGDRLVGVDDRSARGQPRLDGLPRVGGLFNPSLEAVVALAPDVVIAVPSVQQRELRTRMRELGIEVLELPNTTLEDLLRSIEAVGALVGRSEAASERVAAIRAAFEATARASEGLPPVRVAFVVQREPLYLVGAGTFLDAMLRTVGAQNLGAELGGGYPRAGLEWLIAAEPDLLLDSSEDPEPAASYWARWPSLRVGAEGRVVALPAAEVTLAGPELERALARVAQAIRPRLRPGAAPAGTR